MTKQVDDRKMPAYNSWVGVSYLAQFFALIPKQLYHDRKLSKLYKLIMAALPG